ncbi:MAG: type II 3-dehydroquinate dehydratase [Saprospiraceae bacterium]
MHIYILHGPNLNLVGQREPEVYGHRTFDSFLLALKADFPQLDITLFQSNHEGALIDKLHEIGFSAQGIILNAGAYTHTSIALADAVAAITSPVVEVHISNVHAREPFRQQSYMAPHCRGVISGFGLEGYRLAVQFFLKT